MLDCKAFDILGYFSESKIKILYFPHTRYKFLENSAANICFRLLPFFSGPIEALSPFLGSLIYFRIRFLLYLLKFKIFCF